MLNALKVIFLPWLVIAEQRGEISDWREVADTYSRVADRAHDRNRQLRAEIATLKNDANGKVARGKGGRFVSVKG